MHTTEETILRFTIIRAGTPMIRIRVSLQNAIRALEILEQSVLSRGVTETEIDFEEQYRLAEENKVPPVVFQVLMLAMKHRGLSIRELIGVLRSGDSKEIERVMVPQEPIKLS